MPMRAAASAASHLRDRHPRRSRHMFVVNGHRWKKGTRREVKVQGKTIRSNPCTLYRGLVPLSIPAVSSRESKPSLSSRAREGSLNMMDSSDRGPQR